MTAPIALACDVPSVAEARALAESVASAVGMVKVGLELFVEAGPEAVRIGRDVGLPVFLDLKLHDIPETVERAVARGSYLGARLITVHASGGRAMLSRAVRRAEAEGGTLAICAVTILTSLDDGDLASLGHREGTQKTAVALARLAYDEGVRWFVCSPAEVGELRRTLGKDATLVTPGVRLGARAAGDDQKRVATPFDAARDGADWVVVGRPIRDAADRVGTAKAIGEELARGRAARVEA